MIKISFKYVKLGETTILNENNLEIKPGITKLIGENGSGKSTLLNVLHQSVNAEEFKMFLDEVDLVNLDMKNYQANYCTYITQVPKLFSNLTLTENIALIVPDYNKSTYEMLLDKLGLSRRMEKKVVGKLSGGEYQKVSIIIGLLRNTPILLLDEPYNNLDLDSIAFLDKYLHEQEKYLIVTNHYQASNKNWNVNILEIKEGNICSTAESSYIPAVNKYPMNKLVLDNDKVKLLIKKNRMNSYALYMLNLLFFFIMAIAVINIVSTALVAFNDLSFLKYSDTATTIEPPINNSLVNMYGDADWLEITPSFFTDDDKKYFESLDYVTEVISIKRDSISSGSESYQGYLQVADEYGIPGVYFSELSYSSQITTNIPRQYTSVNSGILGDIVAGQLPEDQSDQVIVSTAVADYYLNVFKVSSYEELIDNVITVPFSNVETGEKKSYDFIIVGVCEIDDVEGHKKSDALEVITAFDINSEQHVSLYLENESPEQIYELLMLSYESLDIPFDYKLEDINETYYNGFYIEVSDETYLETLTNEISEYDQYIQIVNNYTISNTLNFRYLKRELFTQLIILIFIIIVASLITHLMAKLFNSNITNNLSLLEFWGYGTDERIEYETKEKTEYVITSILLQTFLSLLLFFYMTKIVYLNSSIIVNTMLIINIVLLLLNLYNFKMKKWR